MVFSQKKITVSFAIMLVVFGMGMLHVSNLDDFAYKIIPGAFAQENKVDEDWLVYDNPEKGITVQYPKNWEPRPAGYKVLTGFYSPLEEGDTFAENVIVGTEKLQEPMALDKYMDWRIAEFKKISPTFTVETMEDTTLSGIPAKKIEFRLNISDIDGKGLQIIAMENNTTFSLTYGAESKNYDGYLPLVNKMIESFTVKAPINIPTPQPEKLQNMNPSNYLIPLWFKNTAGWWGEEKITNEEFFNAMQYLLDERLLDVPEPNQEVSDIISTGHFTWAKGSTLQWSMGTITTEDFVVLVQFFIENKYVTK